MNLTGKPSEIQLGHKQFWKSLRSTASFCVRLCLDLIFNLYLQSLLHLGTTSGNPVVIRFISVDKVVGAVIQSICKPWADWADHLFYRAGLVLPLIRRELFIGSLTRFPMFLCSFLSTAYSMISVNLIRSARVYRRISLIVSHFLRALVIDCVYWTLASVPN